MFFLEELCKAFTKIFGNFNYFNLNNIGFNYSDESGEKFCNVNNKKNNYSIEQLIPIIEDK